MAKRIESTEPLTDLEIAREMAQLSAAESRIKKRREDLKLLILARYPEMAQGANPSPYFSVTERTSVKLDQEAAVKYFIKNPALRILFSLSIKREDFERLPNHGKIGEVATSVAIGAARNLPAETATSSQIAA
jgi:hypothetical protein